MQDVPPSLTLKGIEIYTPNIYICKCVYKIKKVTINRLAPELFFYTLAHPVNKMWIKQEPNTLELWNKLHFEENETESVYRV